MNRFQEIIKNNIIKNIENGDYFVKEKNTKDAPLCKHCNEHKKAVEIIRWGKQNPPIYEWRCDCIQEKTEQTSMAMTQYNPIEEESKLNVVIMVQGKVLYITEDEKFRYLEEMNRGSKIIMIRDYVLDKLYPMMPKDEYERQKFNK